MAADERFCLRVRNLPAVLSSEAVTALLSHYGAMRVRVLQRRNASSGKEPGAKSTNKTQKAIAVFATQKMQQNAKQRLHSLELAGHHIQVELLDDGNINDSVEPERQNVQNSVHKSMNEQPPLPKGPPPPLPMPPALSSMYTPAPLAPHLGLNYAPSPLLAYKYPKATEAVVRNIANALIALPRFYTQVLHLMNKMNLPTPFEEDAIPGIFSLKQEMANRENQRIRKRPRYNKPVDAQIIEEDEDEDMPHETSDQVKGTTAGQHNEPGINEDRRSHEDSARRASTEVHPTIIGKSLAHQQHKRPLINNPGINDAFQVGSAAAEKSESRTARPGVISEIELDRRRMTPEDLRKEPLMATYERGVRSTIVMVQNIAPAVDEKDLRSVFGFILPLDMPLDSMEIVFQREQNAAIITYSDEELASVAVDKLHGVLLDANPLLVSFHKASNSGNAGSDASNSTGAQCWTAQELAKHRMPEAQLAEEKVMKSYQRGEPSNTLYVKNLAKTAQLSDLFAVFGAVLSPESALESLDIHHFTTGRMKCQAFVTYPTVELASKALQSAHGVKMKDKPMIVCFRKPPKHQQ